MKMEIVKNRRKEEKKVLIRKGKRKINEKEKKERNRRSLTSISPINLKHIKL